MKHVFAIAVLMLARFSPTYADTVVETPVLSPAAIATCSAAAASAAEAAKATQYFLCQIISTVQAQYQPPVTDGYTKCADEGGTCTIAGPSTVIFGAGRAFTTPKQIGVTTPCDLADFGPDPAPNIVKSCWVKPAATTTAWVKSGGERGLIKTAGITRFGMGNVWTPPQPMKVGDSCDTAAFGLERAGYNIGRWCEVQLTVPAVTQGPPGSMPVINMALVPPPEDGSSTADVRPLTPAEQTLPSPFVALPTDVGAFRDNCRFSSMQIIDPIVFPGQVGMGHMHTLMGNTGANENSTGDSLLATGNSTCDGGILNRTAYWMPTIVDMLTGQPIVPSSSNQYYKQGYLGVKAGTMVPFPKGLKMIAGDSKATGPTGWPGRWTCMGGGASNGSWIDHIPDDCPAGAEVVANINFPACWDGKNLDSPDHKSHMAYGIPPNGCPADHPVALPDHSQNYHFPVETGTKNWRLSSDMYVGPGGYSLHSDWFGAWDPTTIKAWLSTCLTVPLDCHDDLLGLTQTLY